MTGGASRDYPQTPLLFDTGPGVRPCVAADAAVQSVAQSKPPSEAADEISHLATSYPSFATVSPIQAPRAGLLGQQRLGLGTRTGTGLSLVAVRGLPARSARGLGRKRGSLARAS